MQTQGAQFREPADCQSAQRSKDTTALRQKGLKARRAQCRVLLAGARQRADAERFFMCTYSTQRRRCGLVRGALQASIESAPLGKAAGCLSEEAFARLQARYRTPSRQRNRLGRWLVYRSACIRRSPQNRLCRIPVRGCGFLIIAKVIDSRAQGTLTEGRWHRCWSGARCIAQS